MIRLVIENSTTNCHHQITRSNDREYLPELPDLGGRQDFANHVRAPGRVVGLHGATPRNQQLSKRRQGHGEVPVEVRDYSLEQATLRTYRPLGQEWEKRRREYARKVECAIVKFKRACLKSLGERGENA